MALQTGQLQMIGLGTLNGEPRDPDQPLLGEGIHLRWALPREAGFPWHGFYLFRRKHIESSRLCLSKGIGKPGRHVSPLQVPNGVLTSDVPIVLSDDFAPAGSLEARLDERRFLRLTFSSSPAYQATVQIGFYKAATIVVTVLAGANEVARYQVSGAAGAVEKLIVDQDVMSAIELAGGPAALVDLCYSSVAADVQHQSHWEPVPGFPAPMRLPVSSPAYPLTAGVPEHLSSSRALARSRIRYGDPDRFTAAPAPIQSAGIVSVVPHSPVVDGTGTNWDESVIGGLLVVPGAETAWTVAAVISPTRLVLNRVYEGPALSTTYTIDEDAFGQLHDHLVHLVEGGPVGPAMSSCTLPDPVPASGSVAVHHASPVVDGNGTAWTSRLEGLTVRFGRPVSGSIAVSQGSRYVHSNFMFFNSSHAGLALRADHDDRTYIIERVYSLTFIKIERPYEGASASAASVTLTERDVYTIVQVTSPTSMRLDRNYLGPSGSNHPYAVLAMLHSETGPGAVMPRQNPLDLMLLGSIHPAVAQMLGLYWVDSTVDKSVTYDYMIVADQTGVAMGSPLSFLTHLYGNGFSDAEAFIAYSLKAGVEPPLAAPADVRVYALPASAIARSLDEAADPVGHAGLVWDLDAGPNGELHAGAPVWYNLWRGSAGDGDNPAVVPASAYQRVGDLPIVVAKPKLNPGSAPRPAGDWPPFALNAVDRGLSEGWFSHVVGAVDLFGRFSKRSPPAAWHQWAPESNPRPWYYVDPPADTVIHPFAVRLLDQLAPPPPVAIEAFALDPADPTVVHDAAEQAWRNSLPVSQRESAVGLRIRWQWTPALMRQAPDLREFRIYLDPGPPNSLPVRIVAVAAASATESEVDLDRVLPDGAYVGAALLADQQTFSIVASTGSTVRVRNIGPLRDVRPSANRDGRILIPEALTAGTVALTHDGLSVVGTGTLFTTALVGQRARLEGDGGRYLVTAVSPTTLLTLNRPFAGPTAGGRRAAVDHPLYVDYSRSRAWSERCQVVGVEEAFSTLPDGGRQYEVFRIAPADFAATLAEPIVRLRISVSAADRRTHAVDDPKWNGSDLGGRFGNEGHVGTPALTFRVFREPPPPPDPLPALERVFASRADYHSRSFFTFRWSPQPDLRLHVFRALDESLFLADLAQRPRAPLDPVADLALFPVEIRPVAAGIATALNALNVSGVNLDSYRALDDAALRVLAGLPGNERVYAQLTVEPLDPEAPDPADPAQLQWRDRRGPDDPDDYVPDAALRAYLDALDGRAANRYFYRSAFVDAVHNRGPLGLSSPPVYLPKVVPPRAPSITKVLAGDRQITIRWSSNREADLQAYRVYRAAGDDVAMDLRRMSLVQTEPVPPGDPAARPAEIAFVDTVTPLVNFVYRVVAVDDVGNASSPARAVIGRAFDASRPAPPAWNPPVPAPTAVALSWTASDPALRCLVQRSVPGSDDWENLTGWLPRGLYTYEDVGRIPDQSYSYRLRVLDTGGRTNAEYRNLIA